jgi:hypothetical protein
LVARWHGGQGARLAGPGYPPTERRQPTCLDRLFHLRHRSNLEATRRYKNIARLLTRHVPQRWSMECLPSDFSARDNSVSSTLNSSCGEAACDALGGRCLGSTCSYHHDGLLPTVPLCFALVLFRVCRLTTVSLCRYWRPFGELLTEMERRGIRIDVQHLQEMAKKAQTDKVCSH